MGDDNMFRIDVDKDILTEMLKFKLYSDMISSFCPKDDPNLKKLKACLTIFMEHGIPLKTALDILKELGEKFNKIDEEEK